MQEIQDVELLKILDTDRKKKIIDDIPTEGKEIKDDDLWAISFFPSMAMAQIRVDAVSSSKFG